MEKRKPIRMCIVCRKHIDKDLLHRIVKNKSGEIFVDASKKADGRGCYICKVGDCMEKMQKTRALNRNFKCEISAEIYERIKGEIKSLD